MSWRCAINKSIEFIYFLSYRERKELSNGILTFVIWITQTSENIEKVRAYQIFGTYGGLGALYVRVCVFWTFDTHSHKFQHKNKLHTSFHDDLAIKSIFGDFLITGYEL